MTKWSALLLLTSCATLNTAGMSDQCRTLYNLCLNQCPSAQSANRRPLEPQTGPLARTDSSSSSMMFDVAACTQKCNDDAKLCRE